MGEDETDEELGTTGWLVWGGAVITGDDAREDSCAAPGVGSGEGPLGDGLDGAACGEGSGAAPIVAARTDAAADPTSNRTSITVPPSRLRIRAARDGQNVLVSTRPCRVRHPNGRARNNLACYLLIDIGRYAFVGGPSNR